MKQSLIEKYPYPDFFLFRKDFGSLDKEHKEEIINNVTAWIDALKSGAYEQGQYSLYNGENNSYCCLGVAEKVCGVKGHFNYGELDSEDSHIKLFLISERGGISNVVENAENYSTSLAEINDSGSYSFNEIAEFIEYHFNETIKRVKTIKEMRDRVRGIE